MGRIIHRLYDTLNFLRLYKHFNMRYLEALIDYVKVGARF